jgi:hypothetical protein
MGACPGVGLLFGSGHAPSAPQLSDVSDASGAPSSWSGNQPLSHLFIHTPACTRRFPVDEPPGGIQGARSPGGGGRVHRAMRRHRGLTTDRADETPRGSGWCPLGEATGRRAGWDGFVGRFLAQSGETVPGKVPELAGKDPRWDGWDGWDGFPDIELARRCRTWRRAPSICFRTVSRSLAVSVDTEASPCRSRRASCTSACTSGSSSCGAPDRDPARPASPRIQIGYATRRSPSASRSLSPW